ncbi:hypothetical protein DH2020_012300 [Rehmannia glutinosa]|uniref:Translation initiation factor eIF2B subunit delta n=1 Tax=Rehmannia glutinosa TaxID=99300 RepID=A0ABR0WZD4_REHGL
MDPRRVPRTVIDPKVRQVGFFAPAGPPDPTSSSPPVLGISPSGNSLSPVMIPPPRHLSTELSRNIPIAAPRAADSSIHVGSYNPSEFLSPSATTDFSEDPLSPRLGRRGSSGNFTSSLPSGGLEMAVANQNNGVKLPTDVRVVSNLLLISLWNRWRGQYGSTKEKKPNGEKPLKEKTTKAERRAIQEAQRAAKAAAKYLLLRKKGGDRQPDKDRKKDVPHPRMQFDDENRVEKAKKRSVVKQTEARNRVELFRHLPQYEHGTRLSDLESKFFELDSVHPAVYKVGLRYLAGDISGGNARCIAMLQAFQESIKDYSTPPEKSLIRDLTTKINGYVSYLIECRPLSISMGNAIRFLKTSIAHLPLNLSETEAKTSLISDIDRFISEKIILADKVIVKHAVTKIRDGDVLLTYGSSSAVEMILLHAHELGKQFRVVIVDSRPKLEGQKLLRRLVGKGISCTYTHINAVSYVMHEVTSIFGCIVGVV